MLKPTKAELSLRKRLPTVLSTSQPTLQKSPRKDEGI